MLAGLERFPAKWRPVRVEKTRPNKNLEPRSDSIGREKALVECYADPVLPAPNDMARQFQALLGEDQREFIGNTDQVRKIQRRARGG
jgi:hypothetical protein